jgi:hypothetical protein
VSLRLEKREESEDEEEGKNFGFLFFIYLDNSAAVTDGCTFPEHARRFANFFKPNMI